MPLTLLTIGGTDLTPYIDVQNYNVQKTPVFDEWTDGNHIKHRNVIRTRIAGTVKVGFRTVADVVAFLGVLSANEQAGGYYSAQVFTNDDSALNSADIFIDDTAEIKRDIVNNRAWYAYTLKVEER